MKSDELELTINSLTNDLLKKIILTDQYCNVLSYTNANQKEKSDIQYKVLGIDFYDGITGLCYFLINSYLISKNNVLLTIIDKLIATCGLYYERNKLSQKIGFYDGIAGYYFLLSYAAKFLDNTTYYNISKEVRINLINELMKDSNSNDLISGVAGIILNFSNNTVNLLDEDIQKICTKKLITSYKTIDKQTVYWENKSFKKGLGGLGHGVSGIALSLFRLYQITNEDHFLDLGIKGLNYDEKLFDKTALNWRDNRFNGNVFSNSWCHGSPGMMLTFMKAYELTNDSKYSYFLNVAITNTLRNFKNLSSFCLCHGIMGSKEILQFISQNYLPRTIEIENSLNYEFQYLTDNKYNGFMNSEFHAGFMQGLSGVGHFLIKKRQYVYSPVIFE